MSAPLGPGDWVICVDASTSGYDWHPTERITEGALYQISDCWVDRFGQPIVALVGRERVLASDHWGCRVGYYLNRFRPLWTGEDQTIREHEQPAPSERVPERV